MAYFDCIVGGSGKGNTLVVTCADDLAGATITCTNGTKTYTKTCPSTSPYEVTFYGLAAGTWTVSATVSGNTYTTTVVVADIEALLGGFNWRTWVDTASQLDSSDYDSLDEVLADEEAVRELCLEHNCVDYLARVASATADVETIINNDLFAKWVNNSDYSLDVLGANVAIKALMDTADKYGYGEWALMPQVPKMTSNTAPYGEASASSTWQGVSAYYAFDNDDSHSFGTASGNTTGYVQYKFVNPTNVRKVRITNRAKNNYKDFRIQASNDNSNWTTLYTGTNSSNDENYVNEIAIANDEFFLYYRLQIDTAYQNDGSFVYVGCRKLQFYAWAPKGNVPAMTANNAPYGTAFADSEVSNSPAWKAFDGNMGVGAGGWQSNSRANGYVGYISTNPFILKEVFVRVAYAVAANGVKVQGSNDGSTWNDLGSNEQAQGAETEFKIKCSNNTTPYLRHRLLIAKHVAPNDNYMITIRGIQFYGRELSVSIPKMDTNTTPYGEAFGVNTYNASNDFPPFKAFDGNDSSYWASTNAGIVGSCIGYGFTSSDTVLKKVAFRWTGGANYKPTAIKIQGSDNKTSDYVDIKRFTNTDFPNANTTYLLDISENTQGYKYYRVYCEGIASQASPYVFQVSTLNFYCEDYSEKEFEEGTNKKWLYDHGVELETIVTNTYGSGSSVTKGSQSIYLKNSSSANNSASLNAELDLSPYSLARAKIFNCLASGSVMGSIAVTATTADVNDTRIATINMNTNNGNDYALGLTSINQTYYVAMLCAASAASNPREMEVTEFWLE